MNVLKRLFTKWKYFTVNQEIDFTHISHIPYTKQTIKVLFREKNGKFQKRVRLGNGFTRWKNIDYNPRETTSFKAVEYKPVIN